MCIYIYLYVFCVCICKYTGVLHRCRHTCVYEYGHTLSYSTCTIILFSEVVGGISGDYGPKGSAVIMHMLRTEYPQIQCFVHKDRSS